MSYAMAFKGIFYYPNRRLAKKALKQFGSYECLEESVVTEADLIPDGQSIRVECFTSAPGLMWESTCGAIEMLAELASNGHVNAQFGSDSEDGILRVRILPGGEEEELDGPFPDGMEPTGLDADADDDHDHELSVAANEGDEKKVGTLLAAGSRPVAALHAAVSRPRILEILLAHGLDPVGDAARQYSPLCAAARVGCSETVRMLLAAGARTDETDTSSRATPLMLATEQLAQDTVETLLELGADPNASDDQGNTALLYAVWLGNDECVDLAATLHAAGADPELENQAGETMWDRARNMPYYAELVRRLGG